MMDNFEKYIHDNQDFFNTKKADKNKMWDAISKELDAAEPTKVIPLWKSTGFKIAASIIIILGLLTIAGPVLLKSNTDTLETSYVTKEVLDIEMHYKSIVEHQVKLVQDHPALSTEDKKEFLSFMDDLDHEYDGLKIEMKKNLDNERVLEALIGNYKKRIELIENLLKQINSSKKINDDYGYTL